MNDYENNNRPDGEKEQWKAGEQDSDRQERQPSDREPTAEIPLGDGTDSAPEAGKSSSEGVQDPSGVPKEPAPEEGVSPQDYGASDAPGEPSPAEGENTPQEPSDAPNAPEEPQNPSGAPQEPQSPYGGPYQNPQAPYGQGGAYGNPYGPYGNPYGAYHGPYGNYGNGGYGAQGNGQNPYQGQYGQNGQYWSYQNGQYPPQYPQQPRPPKRKNTGLKVFLLILGILVVGSIAGFAILGAYTIQREPARSTQSQAPAQSGGGNVDDGVDESSIPSEVQPAESGNGTDPNSRGIVIASRPSGSELSAKEIYKRVVDSVVGVEADVKNAAGQSGVSQGTGIIATADGYILTNAHVVNYSRSNPVRVILHNSKQYEATVVGYDQTSDIAVLKINASGLSPATFGDAGQLEVGDQVIAIGNPGGISYASSLTGGYVSALNRSIEAHSDNGMTYIQTDAAINPGNSGGPLVNMYGQVVGINSNKIVATGYEGMGFSIPVSKAKTIINDLVSRGYVSGRSRLGIVVAPVGGGIGNQITGLPTGLEIREISADSDLKKSGVAVGDIITKADGQAIAEIDDLFAVISRHKAGDTITLTIAKGSGSQKGSTRDIKVKLLEDKGETQAD